MLGQLIGGLTSYMGRISELEAGVELFARSDAQESKKIVLEAYIYDNQFELVSDAAVLVEIDVDLYNMDQAEKGHYICSIECLRLKQALSCV